MGLEASIVSVAFIYIHSLCVRAVKTLASHRCLLCRNCNKHSISYVLVNTNEPARSLRLVDKKQVIVSNLGVDGF